MIARNCDAVMACEAASYSGIVPVGGCASTRTGKAEVSAWSRTMMISARGAVHVDPDTNAGHRVTLEDLRRFADNNGDLADPTIMKRAWRT